MDRYAALAALVRPRPTPRIAPDPDDDVVIGTALAAKADLDVTGDKPLLSVAEYQAVRVVGVSHALQIIGSASINDARTGRRSMTTGTLAAASIGAPLLSTSPLPSARPALPRQQRAIFFSSA